jgi:hypothetical protein
VIESLRFAFNSEPDRIKELTSQNGMITKTLGAGSVRCAVDIVDGGASEEYIIERELDAEPRVLRKGTRDPLAEEVLHEIEIYSQGALQQIASTDKPQLRLQLIDRPHRKELSRYRREIEKLIADLITTGSQLRLVRGNLEKKKSEIRDLDQLRLELGRTVEDRPELPPTLEEQHAAFQRRQQLLTLLEEAQNVQTDIVEHVDSTLAARERLAAISREIEQAMLPDVDEPKGLVAQLQAQLALLDGVRTAVAAVPISQTATNIAARFERANEAYYQQRQQELAVSEFLKRENVVRRRIAELEKVEREVRQLDAQRDALVKSRRDARATLASLRDSIFEMRVREVEKINGEFGDVVLLTVRRAAHSAAYVARLSELLMGSRIRTQEDIAGELAQSLSPGDLLEVIEEADAQRLATVLGRDLGQVTRVVTYLRDHPDLYDLEGELFDDSLDITMFDRGQPKAVEQLSEGQRATALLPLILRASSCPLIIDQPEDDLDNSFIFRVLVKNILRLKNDRQLIFITHNANIPVLGDAEAIVVMHMEKPTKAAVPRSGDLEARKEDILELLEGGKEAFEHREQRYGSLLK